MRLNWRRILLIIVCAECLFIYWNSLSTINYKKQQTTHLAPTQQKQPEAPLTQVPRPIQETKIDSNLHTNNKSS